MLGRLRIALITAALWGCASTDLGAPCQLVRPDGTPVQPTPGQVIVQVGSGECQQFICASFNGSPAQCAQPCSEIGDACPDGMVCRAGVLTPTLLPEAQARTQGQHLLGGAEDDFQMLLGGVTVSSYCGPKG